MNNSKHSLFRRRNNDTNNYWSTAVVKLKVEIIFLLDLNRRLIVTSKEIKNSVFTTK